MNNRPSDSKILLMSSFPPTECGIATYTTDILNSISKGFSRTFTCIQCDLKRGNQTGSASEYILNSDVREEYAKIAREVNLDSTIKLVHIQHEFGLFGGSYGNYLFDFLKEINIPVVFTFHSVLSNPDEELRAVVKELAFYAASIIVMTHSSIKILEEEYQIDSQKIECIPHGTHLVRWADTDKLKEKKGFRGRLVLSTFGLLGPGKGIETALKALPEIIKHRPEVLYLIIGKTHPNNIKNNVDEYRNYLLGLVDELKISKNVIFINRYLKLSELLELLGATDIYLFTSKDPNQAVSGTFAYAMSCACPIIATSIPHTREILTQDAGYIINIGDSEKLAKTCMELLSNKKLRKFMSFNAFQKANAYSWENTAVKHSFLYHKILKSSLPIKFDYPEIKLDHFKALTTNRGIIQFSKIDIPDLNSGYTLDDNARALIAICMHYQLFKSEEDLKYIEIYLDFIERCQMPQGTFVNYIDKNDNVHIKNDYVNLEDSNSRAVWALGTVISLKDILPDKIGKKALTCFLECSQWTKGVLSPRSIGYTIKGLYNYQIVIPENHVRSNIENLAKNLITRYDINREKNWEWFEEYMTYANSILPEAMLYAYLSTGKESFKRAALQTFDFLLSKMFVDGQLRVISNRGWYQKGSEPNRFGEQPIDVYCLIHTLDIFYKTFNIPQYKRMMKKAFGWFLGDNHLSQIVYNPLTGGCGDGLEKENANLNQGAESTVCYLMARLIMERDVNEHSPEKTDTFISKPKRLKHRIQRGNKPKIIGN
jgi:glycosyltransferase involved in cell wall biosynthesis